MNRPDPECNELTHFRHSRLAPEQPISSGIPSTMPFIQWFPGKGTGVAGSVEPGLFQRRAVVIAVSVELVGKIIDIAVEREIGF